MSDDPSRFPKDTLRAAALRLTAAAPAFVGFWLARHQEHERLTELALIRKLHLHFAKLPLLALCSTPRPDHFADDVRAVAAKYGADPAALAALISREQARLATAETATASPLSTAANDPLPS